METKITAPLTGRVISIVKHEGDFVQRGEILFHLEAMKMATDVRSPLSGVIKTVLVYEEDRVAAGQLCMTMVP